MASSAMSKSIIVLSVPHQFQGPNFSGYINDPLYAQLVEHKIRNGVDFVFEEAGGLGPTIAEDFANSILGQARYLDIAPTPEERSQLGIGTAGGTRSIGDVGAAIMSGFSPDSLEWTIVAEQEKRERVWLERIQARSFQKGLLICGLGHSLSFAFRLRSVGVVVVKAYNYMPFYKLCNRPHPKGNK